MIYIEPTPYIIALVGALRSVSGSSIEVYYITIDWSQPWKLRLENEYGTVLPRGVFAALQALWPVLARDRARTVLHLAGWGHPVLLGALLMARLLGIPVIVESDSSEQQPNRSWRRLAKKLVYPALFRLPRRFLPAGTRQADYLARFGVATDRMTIAQMTVDVDHIRRFCELDRQGQRSAARTRWAIAGDELVVLYVGRLERYKGLLALLAAFARARAERIDLRLAVVGDGSLRPYVEAIAAAPKRGVSYLGRLSGDDVLRAYIAADVFVLPSLFEPWGLVINEAMACGLPAILTDRVGCADDLVRHGQTGLVVTAGCEVELSTAIRQLAADQTARRRMGEAAERLISDWTLGNEARNIASAWRELVL